MLLVIIGGFVFYLAWEMMSTYTMIYFVILIPFALQGYDFLLDDIIIFKWKKSRKTIGRHRIVIILVIIISVAVLRYIAQTTLFTKMIGLNEDIEVYEEIL